MSFERVITDSFKLESDLAVGGVGWLWGQVGWLWGERCSGLALGRGVTKKTAHRKNVKVKG